MVQPPVSSEIAAALARFYFGGSGPSHSKLSTAFAAGGYSDVAPYDPTSQSQQMNKETRVLSVIRTAVRRPSGARQLIDNMLIDLRVSGAFNLDHNREVIRASQRAFAEYGWSLTDDGYLSPIGEINLSTGGRGALDEQIGRLRRATEDPGQLLGSAKDLLESVAKFVLEELAIELPGKPKFNQVWYFARERLSLLPQQISEDIPGYIYIREVLQSSWKIAEQVNELRAVQGTGHGRTLPTGVTAEMALMIVREACSVSEFVLTTLDRQYGRRQ